MSMRLIILGGLLTVGLYAQKPTSGTVTSEVAITGLNNVQINLVQGARIRYFLTDNLAVRTGFSFDTKSKVNRSYEKPDGTGGVGEEKETFSQFSFLPGAEYHFAGSEKLSTYAGAYLYLSTSNARTERSNFANGQYTPNFSQSVQGRSSFGAKGTTFGFGIYSAFDWYVVEKLYLGVEWGLLFTSQRTADVVIETSSGGVTTKTVQAGGREGSLSTFAIGSVRLGYQF